MQASQNTIVVTIKEQDAAVLEVAGFLGKQGRVLRLEVNGASLEDIFVKLTGSQEPLTRA